MRTVGGIDHAPNLPSEEIFTAPDPTRTHGTARMTRPLVSAARRSPACRCGSSVVRSRRSRPRSTATCSASTSSATRARGGSARWRSSTARAVIGPLGTIFYDTLLDENAASHIAFGSAYAVTVGDADRDKINSSQIHIDVMLGSPEIDVIGVRTDAPSCRCTSPASGGSSSRRQARAPRPAPPASP